MPGITLVQAQAHLDAWLACDLALANGAQSYTIGSRTLTRAQAQEIRDNITRWNTLVQSLSRQGGIRVRYGTV